VPLNDGEHAPEPVSLLIRFAGRAKAEPT